MFDSIACVMKLFSHIKITGQIYQYLAFLKTAILSIQILAYRTIVL